MELNRAQLLVHDDAALNKFKTNHDIPEDVQIEHSGPKEDANLVEGNEDCIPVHTWLIHQDGLWFPINPVLKEVIARCHLIFMQVSFNFISTLLAVDTLMRQMELPFSALDLLHVYMCTLWYGRRGSWVRPCSRVTITCTSGILIRNNRGWSQTTQTKTCFLMSFFGFLENGSSELRMTVSFHSQGTMAIF